MIFVDSNVPMYLVGADHPHKADARQMLERAISEGERLVTDAEVFQEILHRYCAIGRRDAIQPSFELVSGIVSEVFPVDVVAVERARTIVLGHPSLSARDAIHLATMDRNGVKRIMSFDRDFDRFPGIRRIGS